MLSDIILGFERAVSLDALLFCFIGVTIGTFVGVLPGVGALAAVSLCLPLTYYLDPTVALIMLAGIFYGAQYGSSTASILLNVPGTVTAAVTCLDGYPMTKQGRAGLALFVTTICSFVGGSIAIVLMMGFTPLIARAALSFSSAEYFMIMALGLVVASTISSGSQLKSLAMVGFGLALGLVGTDLNSGVSRFTFGQIELYDGISLVPIAMGLFGVAEILNSIQASGTRTLNATGISFRSMLPTRAEWKSIVGPTLRGTAIGAGIGALPGSGATVATFMAYAAEKRRSKTPERFGKGAIEGIAAPEAANNSAVQAAFVPTLSLGIPGDALMAFLLGAMLIHGIVPGPRFLTDQPEMFWGLVASFWIGNVLLLVLNIPLIGLWVRMLSIPYNILFPAMLFFICVGVYSIEYQVFDIGLVILFGLLGFLMNRLGYPPAPLLLGFILGPMMEEHFKRSLLMSRGSFSIFWERPISAVLLVVILLLLALSVRTILKDRRKPADDTA
ncbi:tripartite tricarboxylate transporter permease [Rhodobacterales bacterium HKCCE2091]|nr:tripartite tricarboxylate transporter permease [Rhodobacterales bacterium HKCCE2091]